MSDDARATLTDEEREWYACCLKPGLCKDEHFHERHVEHIIAARVAEVTAERDAALAQVETVAAIHKPVKVYDECDHEDCENDPIEVFDYIACRDSQIGWGCSVCCYDDEYPREDCPHGAIHDDVTRESACPTTAALADPERVLAERDARVLDDATDWVAKAFPCGYELRPDGFEDPERAAYVRGAEDAHDLIRGRARALREGQ